MLFSRRLMKISLHGNSNTAIAVAGNGVAGLASDQLYEPWGMFVDRKLNLYVADSGNHRTQFFRKGQISGETVAGHGVPNDLQLDYSTDIGIDFNNYIYLTDSEYQRVIRSRNGQYRCLLGCTNKSALLPINQLDWINSIRFDSYGHLYVLHETNPRLQKFELINTGCGMDIEQ